MHVLSEGVGPLFMNPDPDEAREHFKKKSRKLESKLMSVRQAVETFVHDGDYLATGGFGGIRIGTAILHEIVRRGRKNLGLSGHTTTHDCQILAAGECFDRCDVAYVIGLEARGLSPQSRRWFESGNVKVCEWTNAGLYWRYQAAALGVPFVAARSGMGTDTGKYSATKVVECPFTGKPTALFPALYPDIAVIHVHECDVYGNARIHGINVADKTLARAAKRLILTTEKLIPNDEIRQRPEETVIPYFLVDAVCVVPYGSFPGNMPYLYYSDERHLREWMDSEKDPVAHQAFVDRYIRNTADFDDYLELCGGVRRMNELAWQEQFVAVPKE